jgi:tRNA dimethylallyltransferase
MKTEFPLITILGPTAAGKTAFAANLALALQGEIISADSRQVFIGMDIGTGKDMSDYTIGAHTIPTHLIDIVLPGTEYNVFQYQRDFQVAWTEIVTKGKTPLLCGGTGLYLEAVLMGYDLSEAPVNENLRLELATLSNAEMVAQLSALRPLHNTTDILDRERLIRAIEIEWYKQNKKADQPINIFRNTPVFGVRFERKTERMRITQRLTQRLEEGMVEEVQHLLDTGISKERLMFYGLEYRYVTMFLTGELSYREMFSQLNTAIHQFSKRQMTWFRRMGKRGIHINWLDGEDGMQLNLQKVLGYLAAWNEKKE